MTKSQMMVELLTDTDRARIEPGFATPVINAFVSTEGLVGHSQPGGSVLSFASHMCLAEPVDDDNQPAPPGVPSTKVLVTNLHDFMVYLAQRPHLQIGCSHVSGRAN
jgi:hypothetical protein